MMRAAVFFALLLAAALCADAAYGPSQTTRIAENTGDQETAPVAFRYLVKPDTRKDFIDAWRKHEKSTAQERDLVIFDLKFPLENNAEFVGYGEWKSMRAYYEHYEADHTQDFLSKLDELDVAYTLEILKRPDVGEMRRPPSKGTEKQQTHFIVKYHVKPSAHKDFLDAWAKAEQGTESEKGVHIYSLRRVVATNTEYYAYGTFADMKVYRDHAESDHIKELLTTLNKHNIIWHRTPLVKVGDQPE